MGEKGRADARFGAPAVELDERRRRSGTVVGRTGNWNGVMRGSASSHAGTAAHGAQWYARYENPELLRLISNVPELDPWKPSVP